MDFLVIFLVSGVYFSEFSSSSLKLFSGSSSCDLGNSHNSSAAPAILLTRLCPFCITCFYLHFCNLIFYRLMRFLLFFWGTTEVYILPQIFCRWEVIFTKWVEIDKLSSHLSLSCICVWIFKAKAYVNTWKKKEITIQNTCKTLIFLYSMNCK